MTESIQNLTIDFEKITLNSSSNFIQHSNTIESYLPYNATVPWQF